jgi:putative phosphoribosyl transferase
MHPREDELGEYDAGSARSWLFADRQDAGVQLSRVLARYAGCNPLVLGIPRGGVPVAAEVAARLGGELDVVVARKIGTPGQEELGIGAIASDGTLYVDKRLQTFVGVSDTELARLAGEQRAEARRREERFRAGLPELQLAGRSVIVVDDGLATGSTVRAAVRSIRRRGAKTVVVAVPVGAPETCVNLAAEVDDVVCPYRPDPFYAVGSHYRTFEQTSDEEVERLLREGRARIRTYSSREA